MILPKYRSMSLTLKPPRFLSCKCCLLNTSAAYIQVRFRLDLFMEADNLDRDQGSYSLHYRLPKIISRREEQTTKVVTGGLRVNVCLLFQIYDMILVRHGLMIVGDPLGGKTSSFKVLADSLADLHSQNLMDEFGVRTKFSQKIA